MKTKNFDLQVKSLSEDGTFLGYGSIFGNVDSYGEKVMAGAFNESLARHKAQGSSVKMLWQHDPSQPIGIWEELTEDSRGLHGKGRLILEVEKAREALALMKARALGGLSIGYREEDTDRDGKVKLLKKLDLYEISPVTFPANDLATIESVKSDRFTEFVQRLKDGNPMPADDFAEILRGLGVPSSIASEIATLGYVKAVNAQNHADEAASNALKALRDAASRFKTL